MTLLDRNKLVELVRYLGEPLIWSYSQLKGKDAVVAGADSVGCGCNERRNEGDHAHSCCVKRTAVEIGTGRRR